MGCFHNFQRYPQIRVNAPDHWEENGSLFDDRTRLAATTKDASEFERRPDSDGVKFQGEAAHMPAVAPQMHHGLSISCFTYRPDPISSTASTATYAASTAASTPAVMVAAVELWQPPGCSRLCDVAVHDRNWRLKSPKREPA